MTDTYQYLAYHVDRREIIKVTAHKRRQTCSFQDPTCRASLRPSRGPLAATNPATEVMSLIFPVMHQSEAHGTHMQPDATPT